MAAVLSTGEPEPTGGEGTAGVAETPAPVMADDQPAGPPATTGKPATDATTGRPATDAMFGRPGRPLSRNPFVVGFVGALGALLAYASYLAIRSATSMLVLIFIALFLAVALNPAVRRLQGWGLSRGVAVLIVGFGTVLVFCGGLFALVPPIISESTEFAAELPDYIQDLKGNSTLNELNDRFDVIDKITAAANSQNVTRVFGGVLGGARLVFGTLFNVFTVFVLTIYFMAAFERLKTGAYRLVPASRRARVELLGDEILGKVGAYMVGALAIALVAGTSTFVFLLICGVAYPFALAFVVAICDLIPQIGATLGAVVVSIVCFATSVQVGIAAAVFFLIYQQLENYVIYPRVMRRSVHVTDLAAIVAALLGVALLGVIGALIAIPAVAAVQLVVREVVLPRQERN